MNYVYVCTVLLLRKVGLFYADTDGGGQTVKNVTALSDIRHITNHNNILIVVTGQKSENESKLKITKLNYSEK